MLVHGQYNTFGASRNMMVSSSDFATRPVPGTCHTYVMSHI